MGLPNHIVSRKSFMQQSHLNSKNTDYFIVSSNRGIRSVPGFLNPLPKFKTGATNITAYKDHRNVAGFNVFCCVSLLLCGFPGGISISESRRSQGGLFVKRINGWW